MLMRLWASVGSAVVRHSKRVKQVLTVVGVFDLPRMKTYATASEEGGAVNAWRPHPLYSRRRPQSVFLPVVGRGSSLQEAHRHHRHEVWKKQAESEVLAQHRKAKLGAESSMVHGLTLFPFLKRDFDSEQTQSTLEGALVDRMEVAMTKHSQAWKPKPK